jgi:cation diffusion facilitator CzcD-associated flavoprotein CzcO
MESTGSSEVFQGEVLHSSELDNSNMSGKTVLIIGSGASGVEAAETALSCGAKKAVFISRSDKVCTTLRISEIRSES